MAAKRGAKEVYIHAFLDGRDMPPRSAKASLEKAATKLKHLGVGWAKRKVPLSFKPEATPTLYPYPYPYPYP